MPRQNTKLESEGAEFLVLGQLLINGISSYKAYTNTRGYDVLAFSTERKSLARISVKSRWSMDATGFIIKNLESDFVVVAKLNRASSKKWANKLTPEFYVLPIKIVRTAAKRQTAWGRIEFSRVPGFKSYAGRWDLIRDFLRRRKTQAKTK